MPRTHPTTASVPRKNQAKEYVEWAMSICVIVLGAWGIGYCLTWFPSTSAIGIVILFVGIPLSLIGLLVAGIVLCYVAITGGALTGQWFVGLGLWLLSFVLSYWGLRLVLVVW